MKTKMKNVRMSIWSKELRSVFVANKTIKVYIIVHYFIFNSKLLLDCSQWTAAIESTKTMHKRMDKNEKKIKKFTPSFGKIKMNLISLKSAFNGWKNVLEKWLKSGYEGSSEIRGKIMLNFIIRAPKGGKSNKKLSEREKLYNNIHC